MDLSTTPIAGVYVATTKPFMDDRGAFARLFCDDDLRAAHGDRQIVQINQSLTRMPGAIRGLHYQSPPRAEAKWVRCLKGRVWDVAVDLRADSSTFLQWFAVELDGDGRNALFIPEGCAHGFQVLAPDSELLYLHTDFYMPQLEGGVRWDDPLLAIDWPLPVADLSSRDASHSRLTDQFEGIRL